MPTKFSLEDDAKLRRLLDKGLRPFQIAHEMRMTRPKVACRIRWLTMSDAERQKRRDAVNEKRRKEREQNKDADRIMRVEKTARAEVVPLHVYLDRYRRMMTPRTLTSAVLGDPPPGYSALDQKRQAMRAAL